MIDTIYEFKGIGHRFDNTSGGNAQYIFNNINFKIEQGERWSIIGPSGCGKSTLLHMMAGLLIPKEGTILYRGRPLQSPEQSIQIILQEYGLFPWKSVKENVALPLKLAGVSRQERSRLVDKMLDALGLYEHKNKAPYELSGGQRQRIAVGRAMVAEPTVLLMDEPFSALDALTRESLQEMVKEMVTIKKTTTILVTHQIEEAVAMANRLLVFPKDYGLPQFFKVTEDVCDNKDSFFELCATLREMLKGEYNAC